MTLPPILVSGYHSTLEQSALVLVDLESGTSEVLRPYPGPVHATPDALYLARFLGAKTRLEKYDRQGLCWMRRVENCIDTHGVVRIGDELAVTSTGTNEIIFLDADGTERRRWSPDPAAEADSWHLNSLHAHAGRLYVSCFGRFRGFRDWSGRLQDAGMVLDTATGEAVLQGLSGPHDPHRLANGWVLNESDRRRLISIPDEGPREVIVEVDGFPRGLLVLPDHYILGVSRPRQPGWQAGHSRLLVIERGSRQIVRTLPLPYLEIGHVTAAPSVAVLESMRQEQSRDLPCLLPRHEIIAPADQAGEIAVRGPFELVEESSNCYRLPIQVFNRSTAFWATENEKPIFVAYQVVNAEGGILQLEGRRTRLPMPIAPGRVLTFPIDLDLAICHHLPAATAVRITLVQERVAWWEASERWLPAVVPLPPELCTPAAPPPPGRLGRWRRRLAPREG